jgi:DNA-binding MarR family transcriptional regulator
MVKTADNTIAVEIADLIFDNIDSVKTHLNLDSYDTTAVVMRITAASDGEGGVSEAKLAQQLNITRPTMNRIIRRLLDTRAHPCNFRHFAEEIRLQF